MSLRAFPPVLVLVSALAFVAVEVGPAHAQIFGRQQQWDEQQPRRGGFFERLFGINRGGDREIPPPPEELRRQQRPRGDQRIVDPNAPPVKKRPAVPSEPAFPVAEIMTKNPDAKKVLVVGDFMAQSLAWGLDQAFSAEPRIAIIDRSEAASGLARNDRYDWASKLPELLDKEKPDMVVVMLGTNDRQTIRAGDAKLALRSDEWQKAYLQRLGAVLITLQTYGRPVYWVGAPPLKDADASGDMAFLNSLYKARVEAVGGNFIDVWDGFISEDGKFTARGPDVDGQARTLRNSDGINFTKSGRRKLAFYVEREIRQDGGIAAPSAASAPTNPNEVTEIGPDGKERRLGPVLSLTDPPAGAADAPLAGGGEPEKAAVQPLGKAQPKPTEIGKAPEPKPGRVDDFRWQPHEGEDAGAGLPNGSVVDGVVIVPAPTAGIGDGASVQ